MGLLEDVVQQALPGGSLNKPLMQVVGALLTGGTVGAQPAGAPTAGAGAGSANAGLAGGLASLVEQLQKAGQGDTVNSWVGTGPNKPIEPKQLGAALGKKTVTAAAQQTGMNEQELLSQLAKALPGIVDKLTANGTIPSLKEVASLLRQ